MKKFLSTLVLACSLTLGGCIEYQPDHTDPVVNQPINLNPLPDPKMVEEEHLNQEGRPLDIVFFVDRSGSMFDDQLILWNSISDITNMLDERNIAYRIGITGTGSNFPENSGVLGISGDTQWVNPQTANASSTLQSLLAASGNIMEAGLDAISYGIGENLDSNGGFYRPWTPLHIITISDEYDQSRDHDYIDTADILRTHVQDFHSPITYTAVLNPFESGGYANLAAELQDAGRTVSIFDADWAAILTSDLDHFTTDLEFEYFLHNIPDPETLQVLVEDDGITFVFNQEDWEYNEYRNSVRFPYYKPESDAVIIVRYTPLQ